MITPWSIADIVQAQHVLAAGEVIAIPTETVYGLAANAYNVSAVRKIFTLKQRPITHPLIVHTGCLAQAQTFIAHFPKPALALATHFWPGPLTLLLPKKNTLPDIVTAGLPCVGVRIPQHPLTLQLLQTLSFPLAAPSANRFNSISPTTAQHVQDQLGDHIMILEGGPCRVGIESTIVGFDQDHPIIYRLGGLSIESITQVVGPVTLATSTTVPKVSGMLAKHYAPQKPLYLGDIPTLLQRNRLQQVGILPFSHYHPGVDPAHQRILSTTACLTEAASYLFAALRELDQLPIDVILATYVPAIGLGRAINDRLQRASTPYAT